MTLMQSRYEFRIGEPAEIAAAPETVEFLAHATSRRVTIGGQAVPGLVVGPNQAQDRILLAASSKAKPGEYTVTLSATSQTGEERETTLDVLVKPLKPLATGTTRNPVVLLNGWETGFNSPSNPCPLATSSSTTFGNLASYLVQDGVSAVFLFDNCVEGAGQPIEALANDLSAFLNSIQYSDGTQVPQIDLVAFSMGGLIARAYLSGLQTNGVYLPPGNTLVGKLVLIATPNFGSFVAGAYAQGIAQGTQAAELEPGSSFLWDLATWNQFGDDLRGVNTIAIIGNAGVYTPNGLANASDGLVSETSASLGFAVLAKSSTALTNIAASSTRIVPYCHVDPSAFTNTTLGTFNCSAPGIANVTNTSHYTGQIVRSFLAGTTTWSSIGTAPTSDTYLKSNGGMFFAWQNANALYVSDMTKVAWGTVTLQDGGDTEAIYYTDFVYGTGAFSATSRSLGTITTGSVTGPTGYFGPVRVKQGAAIASVTPLSTTAAGLAVSEGATITLTGSNFGTQCGTCKVLANPAGSTSQALTVTSWTNTAIGVKLPATVAGLMTITVDAVGGVDNIGVFAVSQATLAVTPASLEFAYTTGGATPAAQSIQITNGGTGTLSWNATTSVTWLNWSTASGTAPSTLSVSAEPAGLSPGTYTGTIQISATGANNSPVSIAVTLTVVAATASLAVSPQSLAFQATSGGAAPAAQTVSIANGGGGTLSWTASGGAFWMSLSATSGNAPGTLSVAVNPANLAAGSYTATVTIAATDLTISPVSVAVTFVVQGVQAAGTITGVANAAGYQMNFAPATWVAIFGTNLSQLTYTWQSSDFVNGALPTSLEGISVMIDGLPAYVYFISPTQINVLAPDDATLGSVQVQVTTAGQASNAVTAQKNQFSPAFFTLDGTHVAALHADYSVVTQTAPAKPGETILLYGTGFGPTAPVLPTGQTVSAAAPLASSVTVTIGGVAVTAGFAGLAGSGLYQFNVTVPTLPSGDATLLANIGGVASQPGVALTVGQ